MSEGTMRYRPHRGGLAESLAEAVVIERSMPALVEHLRRTDWLPSDPISEETVTVEPYGFDERIGWDTHLVCVCGHARGMTDGPVPRDGTTGEAP